MLVIGIQIHFSLKKLRDLSVLCENLPCSLAPGRTGQLPTRSPHRPGRAQLRHPVPLVEDSLNTIRVHPFTLSVGVQLRCVLDS